MLIAHCRLVLSVLLFSALLLTGCVANEPRLEWSELQAMREQARERGRSLDVQPFVDAGLAALLTRLDRAEAEGDLDLALKWLDRAEAVAGEDDPLILQRRAELAMLSADFNRASQLAQNAFEAGPKAGPLCLRSVETMQISRRYLPSSEALPAAGDPYSVCLPDRPARL